MPRFTLVNLNEFHERHLTISGHYTRWFSQPVSSRQRRSLTSAAASSRWPFFHWFSLISKLWTITTDHENLFVDASMLCKCSADSLHDFALIELYHYHLQFGLKISFTHWFDDWLSWKFTTKDFFYETFLKSESRAKSLRHSDGVVLF